ncbi:MAG: peptidoglycan DD-metalloendopeptidase family protein [Candidatus Paceibacterota bacterium]
MKLYQDYKKLFKVLILVISFAIPIVFSYAETALEIQNKINQKNSDISALEREIDAFQAELDSLGQQKSSLNNSLKQLDITRKKLNADIAITEKKIDKTNLSIENLSFDIGSKQNRINNDIEAIKLGMKQINETDQSNMLQTLLSINDFTVIWNDIDNLASVRDKIRENILNLKQVKSELENTRQQTINAKNELTKLKSQLSDQQKIIIQNTKEKNKLLAQTKNSETNYQKLLKDRLAKKEAFEKELEGYESQLKYILDPSKLPSGKVLSWPLDAIIITSSYGLRSGGVHYGIDFRARTPLPVYAMADGVVDGVGDTDIQCPGVSFGRFVLIKYNNGLASTYGHLSLIKVTKGQKVLRGQIVAYSGNTGYSTAPHLHVSVYARDAVAVKTIPSKSCPGKVLTQPISPTNGYLNPINYLPSTNSSMFK